LNLTLIGDCHGKIPELQRIFAQQHPDAICIVIGDVGFGFREIPDFGPNRKSFRGNHDDPAKAKSHPSSLGDWGFLGEPGTELGEVFFLAGANSIDAAGRIPGRSWWADEELSRDELEAALGEYVKRKPRVVITHEAPFRLHPLLCAKAILKDRSCAGWGEPRGNPTAFALDEMLQYHQPDIWVFGHWHSNIKFKHQKTWFVCVDELSAYRINLSDKKDIGHWVSTYQGH
jgi:predicted phosphodiesterase